MHQVLLTLCALIGPLVTIKVLEDPVLRTANVSVVRPLDNFNSTKHG